MVKDFTSSSIEKGRGNKHFGIQKGLSKFLEAPIASRYVKEVLFSMEKPNSNCMGHTTQLRHVRGMASTLRMLTAISPK